MQYTDRTERAIYLAEISDGNAVIGSCQEHASTTRLGVWGDRQCLKTDCATIFGEEMRRYCRNRSVEFPLDHFLNVTNAVLAIPLFTRLFDTWRTEIDFETQLALSSVIESEPEPVRRKVPEDIARAIDFPHDAMYYEMKRYNRHHQRMIL